MSYIPKYILKRLVPSNAVTLEGDMLSVEIINVISPIPIGDLPGSLRDVLTVELDGELVFSPEKQDLADDVRVSHEGEEFTIDTIKEVGGGTIPVGSKFKISMPNKFGFVAGETHTMKIIIAIDSPIELEFERKIN